MYDADQTQGYDDEVNRPTEQLVVNVTDEPVRFEIATVGGSAPRRYILAPWGRPKSSVSLQIGYTEAFMGAGRKVVPPTIETMTEREVFPGVRGEPDKEGRPTWAIWPGKRLPRVVHEGKAPQAREAWLAEMARRPARGAAPRVRLETTSGHSIEAELVPQQRRAAPPPVEDVEDQDGPLDPDPDAPENLDTEIAPVVASGPLPDAPSSGVEVPPRPQPSGRARGTRG